MFTRNNFYHEYVITTIIKMCSFHCRQNYGEKIDISPILSIPHTVTIGTMLYFNGGNKGHGLKNVACK